MEETREESKFITISGTKPTQTIEMINYRAPKETIVTINDRILPVKNHALFLLPNKINENSSLNISFKTGEFLAIRLPPDEKGALALKRGDNRVGKTVINLVDGPLDAYCKNKSATSIYAGLGPYLISDSFTPKDFHTLAFNLTVNHNFKSFIPFVSTLGFNKREFNIFFDITATPASLSGPSRSKQSFYDISGLLGYKVKHPYINLLPHVGYFYYLSDDNYFDSRELSSSMYSPLIGLKLELTKRFFKNRALIDNFFIISPMLRGESSSYRLNNALTLTYLIKREYSLFLRHKKNVFRYENRARKNFVVESYDAFLFGLNLNF